MAEILNLQADDDEPLRHRLHLDQTEIDDNRAL